jgi:hypothetical protein
MSQPLQPLAFVAQNPTAEHVAPQFASRESVARFENLLYAPVTGQSTLMASTVNGGRPEVVSLGWQSGTRLRAYADEMSALWRASAQKTEQLMNSPNLSYRDLLVFQREISSTLVSVELASKTSGMVESGVQTLIQRS